MCAGACVFVCIYVYVGMLDGRTEVQTKRSRMENGELGSAEVNLETDERMSLRRQTFKEWISTKDNCEQRSFTLLTQLTILEKKMKT